MIYIGMVLISIVGTILHFTYELSKHNKFVAIFSAVNESTWEHIKICITPTFLWSLYDGYVNGINSNYLIGKSMCLLTIIILIPFLFYIYTVICSNLVFNYFINIDALPFIYTYLCCILLFIEIGAYMFLTFNPLKNIIFEDPISHKYGLEGHTETHDHKH